MENTDLTFQDEALNSSPRRRSSAPRRARLRSIMEGIRCDTMFDLPGLDSVEQVGHRS